MTDQGGARQAIGVDVMIVGGGLQGLLVLDACVSAGRSSVLITGSDLGEGQTLHAHGLLNTGFGFGGPMLRETRDRLVLPFLRKRGIETYGEWYLLNPDAAPGSAKDHLPAGLDPGGCPVQRIAELNVPRRRLIESLSAGLLDRIVRGRVTRVGGAGAVDTVRVEPSGSGDALIFAPAAVISATGAGTRRFVSTIANATNQLAKIRHRRVHILCVKGPTHVLPAASLLSLSHHLNLVAHTDGQTVVWYSTPYQDSDPNFDDVPDDAEAETEPEIVEDGFKRLETLFPAIATSSELRFTAYAGYRQDIGETAGTPACEVVDGTANLVMALPSFFVNAWSNARTAMEIVDTLAPKRIRQPAVPGAGVGVRVGRTRDDRPGVEWRSWTEVVDGRGAAIP